MINLKSGKFTIPEFIKLVNKARITHKLSYIGINATVNNKKVSYKALGTWVQLLSIDENFFDNDSSTSIKEYKIFLKNSFNEYHVHK